MFSVFQGNISTTKYLKAVYRMSQTLLLCMYPAAPGSS